METPKPGIVLTNIFTKFDYKNRQHRAVLSLCYQYGWDTIIKGRRVADMESLATWLQSEKAPIRKPLTDMSRKELSKTIAALENMVAQKYKQ